MDNIEKYYESSGNVTKAIDRISFEIKEGEFIGIMGESGSCKLRSNGMPVPLLRNGYSIFNGTKYR